VPLSGGRVLLQEGNSVTELNADGNISATFHDVPSPGANSWLPVEGPADIIFSTAVDLVDSVSWGFGSQVSMRVFVISSSGS
jgi:hypothetical protein